MTDTLNEKRKLRKMRVIGASDFTKKLVQSQHSISLFLTFNSFG